jgi:muconolactone delta-isomerase
VHFLVEIIVEFPPELRDPDEPRRRELIEAELARGLELRRSGSIVTIWRVTQDPGAQTLRNVGVWSAPSEEALRQLIASLPLSDWIQAKTTPLERHPIERKLREGGDGE